MVLTLASIETHFLDPRLQRFAGDRLADHGRSGLVSAIRKLGAQVLIEGTGRDQRLAGEIVNHLATDVPVTAMHA